MKKTLQLLLVGIFSILTFTNIQAQDFVYRPKNPAFGGDTFNYNWLLSSAQVQDLTEAPDADAGQTDLEAFTANLERQILSNLSRELAGIQFGETSLEDGSYQIGTFNLDVITTLDGLSITIIDPSVGEQTQIIIPFY